MRKSRSQILYLDSAPTHLMWKCHNKEYYLRDNSMKRLYMNSIKDTMAKNIRYQENVKIHSYCVMSNHFHQLCTYKNGSKNLSDYMRHHHGIFGMRFNKANNRCGKVAYSRPKTPMLKKFEDEVWVHMYIEANPVRAGMCTFSELKNYEYCSFKFYAFGIEDEYTKLLTIPEWYTNLGKNNKQRQKKYRQLFAQFLEEEKIQNYLKSFFCSSTVIGLPNIKINFKKNNLEQKSKYQKATKLE